MTQVVEPPATAPARTITSRWGLGLGLLVLLTGVLLGAGWERSQDVEWIHERATGSGWIRIAVTGVTIEGTTTRPIVAVVCRS